MEANYEYESAWVGTFIASIRSVGTACALVSCIMESLRDFIHIIPILTHRLPVSFCHTSV
jgi:hypothetical protein